MRKRQLNNVDLPAPVLPTIPIFRPLGIDKSMFLRVKGIPSRYRAEKFANFIA